jgi:steroid delta-isomerase-like uncharacterized protein
MTTQYSTLARSWFEDMWNRHRPMIIDQFLDPNCIGHHEGGRDTRGPGEFKAMRLELLEAFPDLHFTVDDVIAEGEQAVVRWSATGTHKGDLLDIPPSGRVAVVRGMTWFKFRNGRIIEGWDNWNIGGMLKSLHR